MTSIGLQGTQRVYEQHMNEVEMYSTKLHDIYEVRAMAGGRSKQNGNMERPAAGITLMVPKGYTQLLKQLYTPKADRMKGRAAVWHFKNKKKEQVFIMAYCPVESGNVEDMRVCADIWNWIQEVLEDIPPRAQIIMMVDANGHIGSIRERHRG